MDLSSSKNIIIQAMEAFSMRKKWIRMCGEQLGRMIELELLSLKVIYSFKLDKTLSIAILSQFLLKQSTRISILRVIRILNQDRDQDKRRVKLIYLLS